MTLTNEAGKDMSDREYEPLFSQPRPESSEGSGNRNEAKQHSPVHIIVLLYLLILIVDFGGLLQVAPTTQIYEDILCRQYYARQPEVANNTLERLHSCKIPPIQSELAFLQGTLSLLNIIPTVLLSIPYGVLVNVYGRRLGFCLALLGFCLQFTWIVVVSWFSLVFPIRLVWLAPIFHIIGGGPGVGLSIGYVIVADSVPEKMRTQVFFGLDAARLVAAAAGTLCSSLLMKYSPWPPMLLALLVTYIGSSLSLFVPNNEKGLVTRSHADQDATASDVDPNVCLSTSSSSSSIIKNTYRSFVADFRHFVQTLPQNKLAGKMLSMSFLTALAKSSSSILLLYASKRFEWSFARSNLLTTLRAIVSLGVILILVPFANRYLTSSYKYSVRQRDTYLARASSLAVLFGLVGIAIAPTAPFLVAGDVLVALGFGVDALLRSMITSVISGHEISIFYNAMTLSQNLGESAGGPFYASLFSAALNFPKEWLGLPYLVAAALAALVTVMFFNRQIWDGTTGDEDE